MPSAMQTGDYQAIVRHDPEPYSIRKLVGIGDEAYSPIQIDLRANMPELRFKRGQVLLGHHPYLVHIQPKVFVDQNIP